MSPVMPPLSSRVHIHSKSTAVGATPVKPGKTYPLSVLDHAMAKHTIHLVFYFPAPVPASMHRDRLKDSLSDLLSHYPVATGRLARDPASGNWIVRCNDAGVRVLDADVCVTLDEWFRTADAREERQLAYWEDMPRDDAAVSIWSPMYIQISEFKDGTGLALGLSCPHMFTDVTCAVLIIKAWADAHRRVCIAHPPFFHPPGLRGRAEPNTGTPSAAFLNAKSTLISPPAIQMATETFRFGAQAVRAARDMVATACTDASPFDALAALFWWRITRARGPLVVCIDFRKRMYAPLPHGFFGNAIYFSSVPPPSSAGLGGDDEEQIAAAMARAVKQHVAGLEEEEYWSAIDWAEARRDGGPAAGGRYGEAFQMYGPGLTVAMLDHAMAYGAVFDKDGGGAVGGKCPTHVSCAIGGEIGGDGTVLVMPHPEEEDGRTVVVTVPAERAAEIRRDQTILGLGATLVFGGASDS